MGLGLGLGLGLACEAVERQIPPGGAIEGNPPAYAGIFIQIHVGGRQKVLGWVRVRVRVRVCCVRGSLWPPGRHHQRLCSAGSGPGQAPACTVIWMVLGLMSLCQVRRVLPPALRR